MRKIFLLVLFACSFGSYGQTNQYATFEADIANADGPIYISIKDKVIKKLEKNSDGVYKDTLKVATGSYKLFDGKQYVTILLNNKYNLKLKMDANNVDGTIVFSGVGSDANNYFTQSTIASKKADLGRLFASDEITFNKKMEELKKSDLERIDKYFLDPVVNSNMKKSIDTKYAALLEAYKKNKEKAAISKTERDLKNAELNKMNGTDSPSFNYKNHKGYKTKLESFKGKYVYIDVWATWCGPCMREVPFLQIVEEKYHGKNIAFVSISIDKQTDFNKWESLVKEKNMGGVQLFADNDWNSDFAKSYGITSIPRFILIDPNGKIVKAVAERPSNPELIRELDELLN